MRAGQAGGVIAVAAGGAVVTGLWMLFERVQRPALEAKSYVRSIHEAAEGWVDHTEQLMAELRRMPEATGLLPALAERYADVQESS